MIEENQDAHDIKQPGLMYCWMCGSTPSKKPKNWFAPFHLEVAHIASGGGDAMRVNDRRAVVLACSLCHRLHISCSESLPSMHVAGVDRPTFDARHSLFMKMKFDRHYFDPQYLSRIWIGELPEPSLPHAYFLDQLRKNQGIFLLG